MTPTCLDIIRAVEEVAPRHLQEGFDNTGLQCGRLDAACTGVLLCVDLTDRIVHEAIDKGCNLIITHHPLLFHAIKSVTGEGRVQRALVEAIRHDITVYSCHTSIDNAPAGISHVMGRMLELKDIRILEDKTDPKLGAVGSGIIGTLPTPLTPLQLVEKVKAAFRSPLARCSDPEALGKSMMIERVALCGGAGSFLLERAEDLGADAFITSDTKFNVFLDCAAEIFLIDIGHFESEECAKGIFYHIITKKFPTFAVYKSEIERNPIIYL
ncbi:MAG: Nif3-like dinuclear metal center hexameric protein [Muribaculaceae bacterium]|nr:Nif3-like dinuclear metal center hexameric protein [Muribaculaceae bacterium]